MRQFIEFLLNNRKAIRKFLVALSMALATVLTVWTTGEPDNVITGPEWIVVALSFLSAIGVYGVSNKST